MRVVIKPGVLPSTVNDEEIGNYGITFILAFLSWHQDIADMSFSSPWYSWLWQAMSGFITIVITVSKSRFFFPTNVLQFDANIINKRITLKMSSWNKLILKAMCVLPDMRCLTSINITSVPSDSPNRERFNILNTDHGSSTDMNSGASSSPTDPNKCRCHAFSTDKEPSLGVRNLWKLHRNLKNRPAPPSLFPWKNHLRQSPTMYFSP